MNTRKRTLHAAAAMATTALAVSTLAACGSGESGGDDQGKTITVQSADTLPDRVRATKDIIADFTKKTGIKVDFVGVPEDQFNQVLTADAAAGELPDVIGSISLGQVRTLGANDLVNAEANAAVIEKLGEDTWSQRALEMTRNGDTQLAVPSEYWAQLLYYRKDLFKKAGLEPPETYKDILKAAKVLDSPEMAGFVGATEPGKAFTHQTFEHIALGNDCEMVNTQGEITIASDKCVQAFDFYGDLIQNYSVAGGQNVDTVRASYFAGKSAMFIWSTFVLDEMAGLRNDAMPTCPQCKGNPAFLAENTGIVPLIQGPDASSPAQFGEITSWSITATANAGPAKKFVEYMLSDGYVDWLSIAPEGRIPVRAGTPQEPQKYVEAWQTLPVGVDKEAPLNKFYSDKLLATLQRGVDQLTRWGITQGQGKLIGAQQGQLPIATAVSQVTSGSKTAEQAAQQAARTLRSIKESLQ